MHAVINTSFLLSCFRSRKTWCIFGLRKITLQLSAHVMTGRLYKCFDGTSVSVFIIKWHSLCSSHTLPIDKYTRYQSPEWSALTFPLRLKYPQNSHRHVSVVPVAEYAIQMGPTWHAACSKTRPVELELWPRRVQDMTACRPAPGLKGQWLMVLFTRVILTNST